MKFLNQYLKMVRDSSIVNMFGAAPYLYIGKDRIEHEFKYSDIHDEDAFNKVLENANLAQAEMINGVINVLKAEGKEESLENINRYIKRYATKVLMNYMNLF
jgi:ribonuclease D